MYRSVVIRERIRDQPELLKFSVIINPYLCGCGNFPQLKFWAHFCLVSCGKFPQLTIFYVPERVPPIFNGQPNFCHNNTTRGLFMLSYGHEHFVNINMCIEIFQIYFHLSPSIVQWLSRSKQQRKQHTRLCKTVETTIVFHLLLHHPTLQRLR